MERPGGFLSRNGGDRVGTGRSGEPNAWDAQQTARPGRPLRVTDPETDLEARGNLLRDPSGISGQRGKVSFTSLGTADRLLGIKSLQCNFL